MNASLIDKLKAGRVAIGVGLQFPVAGIIECVGDGWDWIWIDSQHGQHDYRSILECVRVADSCGIASVVRVSGHDAGGIGRVMDMRPTGIIVPMVNNAQEARVVVDASRFPPLGKRSYGGRRVIDLGSREYYATANEDTLLVAQIETKEAVDNAEEIAAVDGVDVLFVGPDDMKVRMGIPINTPITESDELAKALQQVICSAKNSGKAGGCVAATPASIKMTSSLGYTLIVGGADVGFLREGASAKVTALRSALQ